MNPDASVPLERARQASPSRIVPLFSGASVGMSHSAPDGEPFVNLCDMEMDLDHVFVIIAEVLPGTYTVAARENYSMASPGQLPKGVLFSSEIDEEVLVSCNAVYQCVALKLDGFKCWYQFEFEHEVEYFGFLATLTQVRNSQVHRRKLIERQIISFRDDFMTYFKPMVSPYGDFGEIMGLIELEAEVEEVETVCEGNRFNNDEDSANDPLEA